MGNDTHVRDVSGDEGRLHPGGLLLVDKPEGVTSHDVVAAVRKRVRPLKVGHTGTLDPLATGLLVLCIGEATKLARFLEARNKLYGVTALLGVRTDTQDITGDVVAEKNVGEVAEETIKKTCRDFVGAIEQTPPAFSAVRVNGVRAYKRARRSEEVSLESREIQISRIEIQRIRLPRVDFLVECSKGTYVRTLCHDIGEHLGIGGCMESLRRLAVGRFDVADALPLDELHARETIFERLIPAQEAIAHLPVVTCDPEQAEKLSHGMAIAVTDWAQASNTEARALGADSKLLAVGKVEADGEGLIFRPKRVFAAGRNQQIQ
jgi:tRNA pseudouridine55 synthase